MPSSDYRRRNHPTNRGVGTRSKYAQLPGATMAIHHLCSPPSPLALHSTKTILRPSACVCDCKRLRGGVGGAATLVVAGVVPVVGLSKALREYTGKRTGEAQCSKLSGAGSQHFRELRRVAGIPALDRELGGAAATRHQGHRTGLRAASLKQVALRRRRYNGRVVVLVVVGAVV